VASKSVTIDHAVIGVPNLQVVKLMISMKSRGLVRENFCWAHHYFYLTDKGIDYLRDYLHLPADIIPATLKKPLAAARPAGFRSGEEGGEGGKDGGPSGDFKPSYRGGREEGYRREGGQSTGGGFGRGRAL